MTRATILVIAMACLLSPASDASADVVINGGFETGNFSGWSTSGVANVEGTSLFGPLTISPAAGAQQAWVSNSTIAGVNPSTTAALESFLNLGTGTLNSLAIINSGGTAPSVNGSAIKQLVNVNAGDTLVFQWNFATADRPPLDVGFLVIDLAVTTLATPASVGNTANNVTASGYQTYTHTFNSAGTFLIGLGVINSGDSLVQSRLYVDGLSITAAAATVPEPGSIAIFCAAFAVAGACGWRKRCR